MKSLKNEELDEIKGGQIESVTVVKILQDAGYSLGSGARRIVENSLCPLE